MSFDVGAAMTAAFDEQRRTDVCRIAGRSRLFVDWFGPTSRACGADVHDLCGGEFHVLTASAPCLCPCHASNETQRANLAALIEEWHKGAATTR